MNAERILLFIIGLSCLPLAAQQNLPSNLRKTGAEVVSAFEPQRAAMQKCSAVLVSGRKELVYGVVVSSDGLILTKASEVQGITDLEATVDRTRYKDAKVIAIDPVWDVALVKVDAEGLEPVTYAPTSAVPQGTWVVMNGATTRRSRRVLAGIISANAREIPAEGGAALGVALSGDKKLEIGKVQEGSGAEDAGLKKGDVIIEIAGAKVKKIEDIAEVLKDRKAGTVVKIRYERDGGEFEAEVRLAAKGELFGDEMQSRNDVMSGDFSKRRSGFPKVLQTDIICYSHSVGGPLLDLDGRCLGMNIARANRAETFVIPLEELKEIDARLRETAAKG
ncbi:MAG: trypsin-like peptidase domain-containing protein [Akkermansiaceae bacterium]|nr:trypsin-like peptidase domain-containing protein [Akkermansiaceae bacterium]